MKKKLLTISIAIFSFISLLAQTVEIKGLLKNNNYYDTIYISTFINESATSNKAIIDESGNFKFSIPVPQTDFYRMWVDENNYVLLILSPKEKIEFTADASNMFATFEAKGSKETQLFVTANNSFSSYAFAKDSLKQAFTEQSQLIELQEQSFALDFVKKNKSSLTALMYIDKVDKESHMEIYKMVDSALMLEYPNNKLVNDFHKEVLKMNTFTINSTIPDIELKDGNGKIVKLSSLRGKIVLIDFWATWCGPCKAEIPNLKRTYSEFKDKGFEIYSISIDQQKEKWDAEQHLLPWINVWDEGGQTAQIFNIVSIPTTFLIDGNGKLIAKNLRGSELYMKVSDILNK